MLAYEVFALTKKSCKISNHRAVCVGYLGLASEPQRNMAINMYGFLR